MLLGHKDKWEYFDKLIEKKALSHAYVFDGIKGIGKSTFAREISKKLLCSDDLTCNYFDKGSHPDYLYIEPENDKILSATFDAISQFLSVKPHFSDFKIVHIDDCDTMNLSLQNKLLKTIEEPKQNVVFILTTSKYEILIDTVKSRLIRISFNPLSKDDIIEYAKRNNIVYKEENLSIANGSIGRFLEYVDSNLDYENIINSIVSKDYLTFYDLINKVSNNDDSNFLPSFKTYLISLLKSDCIISKIKLIDIIDLVTESEIRIKRNQNYKYVVTYTLHKIREILE